MEKQIYVAKYVSHAKGDGRYVWCFKRQMMDQWWRDHATEEDKLRYIKFQMTHEQYHLSTDSLQVADWVYEEDMAVFSKYLNVTYHKVELRAEPIAPATEVKAGEWCNSVIRLMGE